MRPVSDKTAKVVEATSTPGAPADANRGLSAERARELARAGRDIQREIQTIYAPMKTLDQDDLKTLTR